MKKISKDSYNYTNITLLFILYYILLIWFVIFHMSGYAGLRNAYSLLEENTTIAQRFKTGFLYAFDVYGWKYYVDLVSNIILFIPFGMVILLKNIGNHKFLKGLLMASITSLVFEVTEGLTRIGNVDLLDFLMNLVGFIIGYFIINFINKKISVYSMNKVVLCVFILFVPLFIFAIISMPFNWYRFKPFFDFEKYPYIWK